MANYSLRTRLNEPERDEVTRRFTGRDLLNAKIITQVDRKFIACLMNDFGDPNGGVSGDSLILIDQHAADERIRVERYLKELCLGFLHWEDGVGGHRTRELSPAIAVLLTRREAHRLGCADDIQMAFKRWGIRFAVSPQMDVMDDGDGYSQVWVQAVPEIVGDKVLSVSPT